jgi:hypothetical protein
MFKFSVSTQKPNLNLVVVDEREGIHGFASPISEQAGARLHVLLGFQTPDNNDSEHLDQPRTG